MISFYYFFEKLNKTLVNLNNFYYTTVDILITQPIIIVFDTECLQLHSLALFLFKKIILTTK